MNEQKCKNISVTFMAGNPFWYCSLKRKEYPANCSDCPKRCLGDEQDLLLTPEEMICPECKGEGGLRGVRWDEIVTHKCPTCQGAGKLAKVLKHRLDRPDREKIEAIFKGVLDELRYNSKFLGYDKGYGIVLDPFTDQIIALFPDIDIKAIEALEKLQYDKGYLDGLADIEAKKEELED